MLDIFVFKRVDSKYKQKPFDCGDVDLNEFFLKDSIHYNSQLLAITYIFESEIETVAFFSLSNDKIVNRDFETKKTISHKLARNIPNEKRRPSYPAVKIGRFGVHIDYQNRGIGSQVIDFIKVFLTTDNKAGFRFITVDAYNTERTIGFYESHGFRLLTQKDKDDKTRLMYFDLKTFIRQIKRSE